MPNLNSQMHPKHPQIQFPQSLLGPTPSNLDSPTACRAPTLTIDREWEARQSPMISLAVLE